MNMQTMVMVLSEALFHTLGHLTVDSMAKLSRNSTKMQH